MDLFFFVVVVVPLLLTLSHSVFHSFFRPSFFLSLSMLIFPPFLHPIIYAIAHFKYVICLCAHLL